MQKQNQFLRFALIGCLLIAGIWLLFQKPSLSPETVSRQQSLLQAYAPVSHSEGKDSNPMITGQRTVMAPVSPVVVEFTDVEINTENPDGMYNRWLRGELDLDENDGIISELEKQKLIEEALKMPPSKNVQLATSRPMPLAPISSGVAFDSMDYTDGGGSVPPDPEMAAGPNHLIATVNVAVAIYDKSGTAVFGPTAASNLFSQAPCTSGLYDPNVIYDEEAQRWFLAYDQGAQSASGGYCVLASQTNDPTGAWNEYFFQTNSSGGWLDYPHAGVGDEYIFMGGNIFGLVSGYVEARIYAFNKADLYAGNPVSMIVQGLGATYDTPQPLNLHGYGDGSWPNYGDTHYFLSEPYDGANYTLFEWDTTTITNHGNINLGTGGMPIDTPQSGGGTLQGNDFRPQDFEYRNGYGWTAMAISCNPGSGTVNCVRWAQIDLASSSPPTLGPAGSGVYASAGEYRTFPDLAVNACNDMAIGYTKSSTSTFPAIWITGREDGDTPGTLQAEALMKAGEITYTSFETSPPRRWGDYTGMTIDPDGLTFWYLGEYSKDTGTTNGRWGTYIASYNYSDCTLATLSGTVTDNSSGDPIQNATIDLSLGGSVLVSALTDASGDYTMGVSAGTYDVTASAFGYISQTVTGIALNNGATTIQDFSLSAISPYTVTGVVTDINTGWPLYASINIPGYPENPVWTNPETGAYTVTLPGGVTHDFTVSAWANGYNDEVRTIGPLTGDATENFALDVNAATCDAPGYVLSVTCDAPNGGLVVGNVYDGSTTTGLNGATVFNEDGYSTTSAATPSDPNVAEGFYTLYSPAGVKLFTASNPGYLDDTATPTVIANNTIRQDFNLFTNPSSAIICNTTSLAIPDGVAGGADSTLTIPQTGIISDVNLYLQGSHTWVGDLIFTLTHPNGTTSVTAVDRPGTPPGTYGCGNDDFDLWLDDAGTDGPVEDQCSTTPPALFGRATPNNALSALNGLTANGDWTLNVSDQVGVDSGTLQEWCLEITTSTKVWRGTQDSDWNNAQNWASGAVPVAADDVILDPNYLSGANAWPVLEVDPTVADLTLEAGAELSIPNGRSLTVNGTLTNNGLLRQTIDNVNSPTTFLGMGGYGGVEIDPAGNMGSTTIEIRGNQDCTTDPTSQAVQRCFDIAPTTAQTAVIRFYYLPGEANGNPENGVGIYHWSGSSWDLEAGTTTHSSGGDPRWVQVTGVSAYSPFVLDNTTPTAVSLTQFGPSNQVNTVMLLLLVLFTLTLLSWWTLKRRHR